MTHRALIPVAASLVLAVACDDPDTEVNADAISANAALIATLQSELETVKLAAGDTTAVEALQADVDANTAAVAEAVARLESIEADYLTASDKDALDAALAALTATVDGHTTSIADNGTAIAANATAHADNAAAIATNATAHADNAVAIATNTTAVAANTTDIASGAAAIADNAADIATNADAVATNTDAIDELQTDLTALDTDFADFTDDYEGGFIDTDTTWVIGSSSTADYSSIPDAWEAAREVRVLPGALLTLEIENGTYTLTDMWYLDHPDGERIEIIGNETNQAAVDIRFPGKADGTKTDGIRVERGYRLRLLKGVTLTGSGTGGCGVNASTGGKIRVEAVTSQDFTHGYCVQWDSALYSYGTEVVAQDNSSYGFYVVYNSTAHVPNATSRKNGNRGMGVFWNSMAYTTDMLIEENASYGLDVAWGAAVHGNRMTIEDNSNLGAYVRWNATAFLNDTTSQRNGSYGFLVYDAGIADLSSVNVFNNRSWGVYLGYHGYARRGGWSASGNTNGNITPTSQWTWGNGYGMWN